MAIALKFMFIALFLVVFIRGTQGDRCGISSIQVETINTDMMVSGGDMVFEVQVKNLCPCTVRNVRLDGAGFASTVDVDPVVFHTDDGNFYVVNGGEPIESMATVTFRYAWDHFFQMTPRSLEVDGPC